ncbi:MAG: Fe-S protein assembly co-chaperone HscB [Polyangiaceae bacterium]
MVDPFETLGIAPSFDVDLTSVEKRYRELAKVLHPDRHVAGSPADRRIALGRAVEVNEAWRLVRDPIRRAEALLRRSGVKVEEGKEPKADPEFLMEMMEQREALSAARASGDPAKVEVLAADIRGREKDVLVRIATAFACSGPLDNVLPLLGELRYYRRFLDEVSAIEDGFHEAGSPSQKS